MYNLLKSFYKYGFVIIKNLPTKNNFIIKFANSIGNVRATNFGEFFNVKSLPNPNDLAYTSLPLSPHTDNPYRKPIPCIQLLHCIENEVSGGRSTLVDGFKVANYLKKINPNFFKILTKIKVKFKFTDKNVVLENDGPLIELDDNKNLKQVRFSTRLDFVPILKKSSPRYIVEPIASIYPVCISTILLPGLFEVSTINSSGKVSLFLYFNFEVSFTYCLTHSIFSSFCQIK